jgi:hypothetical protein
MLNVFGAGCFTGKIDFSLLCNFYLFSFQTYLHEMSHKDYRVIYINRDDNFYSEFHPGSSPGQVVAKNQ